MEQNTRYVFIRPLGYLPDDEGAPGSLGVPLTAGRSLAVDKSVIPLGTPVFIATTGPVTASPSTAWPSPRTRAAASRGRTGRISSSAPEPTPKPPPAPCASPASSSSCYPNRQGHNA